MVKKIYAKYYFIDIIETVCIFIHLKVQWIPMVKTNNNRTSKSFMGKSHLRGGGE